MEFIYAIIIVTIILAIISFLNTRPHIKIIKYFNYETRLIQNKFSNKYYLETLDCYGWFKDDTPMDIEITNLKQYKILNKKYIHENSSKYKFENKKKK